MPEEEDKLAVSLLERAVEWRTQEITRIYSLAENGDAQAAETINNQINSLNLTIRKLKTYEHNSF